MHAIKYSVMMNRTSFVRALEHGLLLIDLAAKVSIDISSVNKKLFFDIKKQLCFLLEKLNREQTEGAIAFGSIRDLDVNDIFKELDAETMDAFWNEYSGLNEKFKEAGLSPKDINREYNDSDKDKNWFQKFTNRFNVSGTNLKTVEQKSASAFIWITVVTIVLLLFFQIYWITGNSLLIPKPQNQLIRFDSLFSEEISLNNQWEQSWEVLDLEKFKYREGFAPYENKDTVRFEHIRLRKLKSVDSLQKLSQVVYFQRSNLTKEIGHQYSNILDWNKVWETISLITVFRALGGKKKPAATKEQVDPIDKAIQTNQKTTEPETTDSAGKLVAVANNDSLIPIKNGSSALIDSLENLLKNQLHIAVKSGISRRRDSLQMSMNELLPVRTNYIQNTTYARNALTSFQSFILPLLYGILGALLFILRKYKSRLKAGRSLNATNYLIRIVMGGLAGLAIGWFVSIDGSDAPFQIGNLSPLALSFLAGYGVEILFTGLDTIVSKFSNTNGQ